MSDPAHAPMAAHAFLAWSEAQPKGARHELVAGQVVRLAAERAAHARAKLRIAEQMSAAVCAQHLACEVFGDGMAVLVDEATVYEPDAQLRRGPPLPDAATHVSNPLVVVEVVSPSSAGIDTGTKLADDFRLPSLRHYLIVRATDRVAVQHSRAADGTILTRIVRDEPILLEPPGITLPSIFG